MACSLIGGYFIRNLLKRRRAAMHVKTIRQSVTFKAKPHEVYEIIMDAEKHSILAGSTVQIDRNVGSAFSVYNGDIQGVNLELIADQKIVQSWRYSDWPEGHYSKATFHLKEISGGTRLIFTQTGVPDRFYEDIKQGWKDYYWEPMKVMLEKK
jgi:activator of HSP90 ATPase